MISHKRAIISQRGVSNRADWRRSEAICSHRTGPPCARHLAARQVNSSAATAATSSSSTAGDLRRMKMTPQWDKILNIKEIWKSDTRKEGENGAMGEHQSGSGRWQSRSWLDNSRRVSHAAGWTPRKKRCSTGTRHQVSSSSFFWNMVPSKREGPLLVSAVFFYLVLISISDVPDVEDLFQRRGLPLLWISITRTSLEEDDVLFLPPSFLLLFIIFFFLGVVLCCCCLGGRRGEGKRGLVILGWVTSGRGRRIKLWAFGLGLAILFIMLVFIVVGD